MVKARIAEGYPKFAQYTGKTMGEYDFAYYVPTHHRGWWPSIQYKLTNGECIILANASWRAYNFHFVPLKLLEENRVPINCILTWVASYDRLPRITENQFVIL